MLNRIRKRPRLALLTAGILCVLQVDRAAAVIIFTKGNAEPIVGHLVAERADGVDVRVRRPDGSSAVRTIARSKIEDLIQSIDTGRLAKLSPEEPLAYRDYAEELTAKKKDPEARDMALRLYLIAASLDPAELGRSSLLGMSALARDAAESRKFRAMAFLLDADHDRSLLGGSDAAGPSVSLTTVDPREKLLEGIRLLRRGQRRESERALGTAGVSELLATYQIVSREDLANPFVTLSSREAGIEKQVLRKLIDLELLLASEDGGRKKTKSTAAPWSSSLRRSTRAVSTQLSLNTLTEFDPRASVYQDGVWERPAGR